jgi:hypothetical protein
MKNGTWKFLDPGFLNLCRELLVKSFVRAQASWLSFGSWTCWCFEKTTRIGFSWRTRLFRWVRAEQWFDCLFDCIPTSGSLMVVGHLQQSVVFLVVKNFYPQYISVDAKKGEKNVTCYTLKIRVSPFIVSKNITCSSKLATRSTVGPLEGGAGECWYVEGTLWFWILGIWDIIEVGIPDICGAWPISPLW